MIAVSDLDYDHAFSLETDDGVRIANNPEDLPPLSADWTDDKITGKPTRKKEDAKQKGDEE